MPRYSVPNSDPSRLAFMNRAVRTANSAITEVGTQRLDATLIADLTAHYDTYRLAYDNVEAALSRRKNETAESAVAMARLQMFISHMWTSVYNRSVRDNHPAGLLGYYKLNANGSRPTPSGRDEWLDMATSIINGEAKAVAAGYAPICSPTIAELQAALTSAQTERDETPMAEEGYDEMQAALAALRPRADELIKETRDVVLFSARKLDAPSQRRILRNYGGRYYYEAGEKVDDGDETAVFEEETG